MKKGLWVALVLVASVSGLQAQLTFWANSGTGDWTVGANWSNGLPVSGELTYITNGGTAELNAASSTGGRILMSDGSSLNILNGAVLTSNGDANATIGSGSGGATTVTVDNATWDVTNTTFNISIIVGNASNDNNVLNVRNGGILIANGGNGSIRLGGSGSGTQTLAIGNGGTAGIVNAGEVTASAFGTRLIRFNHNEAGYIFSKDGTAGTAGVVLSNSPLSVIQEGSGRTIFTANNSYTGTTTISAGTLQIGAGGSTGTLGTGNVINDGTLVFNRDNVYSYAGTISGSGSVRQIGSGTMTLSGTNTYTGGTTVKAGMLVVTGSITHSAADMVVGDSSGDNGTLILSTGTSSSLSGYIAKGSGSQGLVQVNNDAVWNNAGELYAGYEGFGTLDINTTGSVSNTKSFIGVLSGSTGQVNLYKGTWTNTGEITVGYQGSGSLLISGGTASSAGAYLGYNAASDDNYSEISGSGVWNSTATFHLGYEGSGNEISISGGGKLDVSNLSGTNVDAIIGFNGGSNNNKMTVTGTGSEFKNNATFYVGRSGTGNQLEILDGGVVTSKNVRIGGGSGSNGTTSDNSVLVDGEDSAWTISGTLRVGSNGDNSSLTVSNGAALSVTGNSFLGYDAVSDGNTVSVKGTNSTWTASALTIGRLGTNNTVEVFDGGKLSATSITLAEQAGSSGTLEIGNGTGTTAGVIDTATVTGGAGTASVHFNHTSTGYYFSTTGTSAGTGVAIAGNTSVSFLGSGTTTLTAASTYTGNTAVTAGTVYANNTTGSATGSGEVTVGSGATLGGSGIITGNVVVQDGGVLAPGNSPGILTLGSLTLNASSTTRMEINGLAAGSQHDQLQITNNAFLAGTLDLVFGYVPTGGDSFTLIQSTSGTVTGTFSGTTTNLGAALKADAIYNPSTFQIQVNLVQEDFRPFAGTPNQNEVAKNLDTFSRSGKYQDLIDYLNSLSAEQLPGAFDRIAPDELAALTNIGFANTRGIFGMLGNRVFELQNGQQYSGNGLALWDNGREFQETLFAGTDMVAGGKLYVPKVDDKRLGFFVSGSGIFGDVDGDGNGDNYDFSTGGLILGSDYKLTEHLAVGLYAGYQGTNSDSSTGTELEADSAKFGIYGTYFNGKGSWLSGNIGGGCHSYDSERATVGGIASGSTNGTEINGQLTYGYDFKAGANSEWTFGPEVSAGYTHLWIDGFNETGSAAPLNIQDQSSDSLRSTLLGKVSYDLKLHSGQWTLRPYARLGWQHEFMDDSQAITARFDGAGGGFTVNSADQDADSVIAGAGAQMFFSETISAQLGYSAEANADYELHSINGSLNFRF